MTRPLGLVTLAIPMSLAVSAYHEFREHRRPLTEIAPNWYILNDAYPQEAAPLPR